MGVEPAARECEAELLRGLNVSLHAMSQPLTALLCMLEYGADLDTEEEVKGIIAGGLEQCLRLMETVREMQKEVVRAAQRKTAQRAAGDAPDKSIAGQCR